METPTLAAATTTTALYEAVLKGDVDSFLEFVKQDPVIIDRCFIKNASSPSLLHVAAEKGHLEMVKALLHVRPSTCLARDQDGRSPIHLAAIQGHINVVEVLHEVNSHAAQERTNTGDTILHLCVKHNQLKTLKTLLKLTRDDDDDGGPLLNSIDNNGNTVLHLAMITKQYEMVEYLLAQKRMKKNAVNKNKMSVADIYVKQSRKSKRNYDLEVIGKSLKRAKAKRGKVARNEEADAKWLAEQRTSLMVVASLIAAAAFQVGINPRGGVCQEDNPSTVNNTIMAANATMAANTTMAVAGESVWSSRKPNPRSNDFTFNDAYNLVEITNAWALISSLSVILLLISGLPCKRFFIPILRTVLWITVTATTQTYLISVTQLTSSSAYDQLMVDSVTDLSILMWLGLALVFFGNVMRFIWKLLGWKRKEYMRRFGNNCFSTLFMRGNPDELQNV